MSQTISAIIGNAGISLSTLWSQVQPIAPYIITIFAFSFGFNIIRGWICQYKESRLLWKGY